MLIHFLNQIPQTAALMHCDDDVRSSPSYILTVLKRVHGEGDPNMGSHLYVIWATASRIHYRWLQELGVYLCNEHRARFRETHPAEFDLRNTYSLPPRTMSDKYFWHDPPNIIPTSSPDEPTIQAHQQYYRQFRATATYKFNDRPAFMLIEPHGHTDSV